MKMSRLSLTVLVDNTALPGSAVRAEAGLSFLMETEGKKILFDTRMSSQFFANARKMGRDLSDLDILSSLMGTMIIPVDSIHFRDSWQDQTRERTVSPG